MGNLPFIPAGKDVFSLHNYHYVLITFFLFFYQQYKVYKTVTSLPGELSGILDHETFEKARLYSLDKTHFGFFSNTWSQILSTVCIFS